MIFVLKEKILQIAEKSVEETRKIAALFW